MNSHFRTLGAALAHDPDDEIVLEHAQPLSKFERQRAKRSAYVVRAFSRGERTFRHKSPRGHIVEVLSVNEPQGTARVVTLRGAQKRVVLCELYPCGDDNA